ncbi:SDR family NAD(P)-dependent oxidoreductase [Bradyrhizobium erythrophlei]|uniref:UDP-glucose 4-epimerase n=1 Tax=Bradyrhizobium erythrophlei TaxID=1437360 RepID=A0A1M5JRJ3_9BRAD|nr:SDR family NAD(P)-dependent oxidoreductase [Bradyrhizobium erythrophlei]SHG43138.1 UDP-glucose 4-epimerase [Bradyrhizobium erythrophlei]
MRYVGARALVTGADGFIGSHLTEALVQGGADVTALALYNSFDSFGWLDDLSDEIRAKIKLVRGDVRDSALVDRIVEGQDIVFHLAALIAIPYSYAAPQAYVETNILGTLNVLEAARRHGTRRVIHTSTSEVYGTALTMPIDETHPLQGQSPYSASKIGADMMAEAFARSFGVPVVILRPFNTYGPRQSERAIVPALLRQILDARCTSVMVGDTTTVRDLTFVNDTVRAFMAAGSANEIEYGGAYNAGSQRSIKVAELVDIAMELTSCKKPVRRDGARLRPPNSEVRALLANARHFQQATGWEPRIPLREGLQHTIAWWQARLSGGVVRRHKDLVT